MLCSAVLQLASGAVHCQIIDALHPGTIQMSKVNFGAKSENESISNYKVLQTAFDKLGVDKQVDVTKLIKARPVDNLEFLQWMKHYYDTQTAGGVAAPDYDPIERRARAKGGANFGRTSGAGASNSNGRTTPRNNSTTADSAASRRSRIATGGGSGSYSASTNAESSATGSAPTTGPRALQHSASTGGRRGTAQVQRSTSQREHAASAHSDSQKVKELEARVGELKVQADRSRQECEFYFEKLQDIERLCLRSEFQSEPLVKAVQAVLYHEVGRPDLDACIAEAFSSDAKKAAEAAASSNAAADGTEKTQTQEQTAAPHAEKDTSGEEGPNLQQSQNYSGGSDADAGGTDKRHCYDNEPTGAAAAHSQSAPKRSVAVNENTSAAQKAAPPATVSETDESREFMENRENLHPQVYGRDSMTQQQQQSNNVSKHPYTSKRSLSADFGTGSLMLDDMDGMQGLVDDNNASSPTAALQGDVPPSMPSKSAQSNPIPPLGETTAVSANEAMGSSAGTAGFQDTD